jgi:hypothetical protein
LVYMIYPASVNPQHLVTQSEMAQNVITLTINSKTPLIKGRTYAGLLNTSSKLFAGQV